MEEVAEAVVMEAMVVTLLLIVAVVEDLDVLVKLVSGLIVLQY